jgi:glucose 1-dehydrogenase
MMSRILVTGGSRGIGRSICLRLARDAKARGETPRIAVTATGASPDLEALVAELKGEGVEALAIAGDLADGETPARIVAEAVAFCGGLDILVHNAGGPIAATFAKTKLADWDTVYAVNCRALFLLAQAALPELRRSKGSICAIASVAAERVQPFLNAYPTSKAAVVMLVQQLAYEWGRFGIRVNSVSPGFIMSGSTGEVLAGSGAGDRAGAHLPLGRLGRPDDIAAAVAFMVGPDAAYITGENLNVDGGLRQIGSEALLAEADPGANWSASQMKASPSA